LFVLDVDSDKGGVETLEAREDEYGDLPITYTVQTGRGGMQFYFQYPKDGSVIKSNQNVLGSGVDVRGEPGYVVAPPGVTQDEYRRLSLNDEPVSPEMVIRGRQRAAESG
jgi:hypothetical protein